MELGIKRYLDLHIAHITKKDSDILTNYSFFTSDPKELSYMAFSVFSFDNGYKISLSGVNNFSDCSYEMWSEGFSINLIGIIILCIKNNIDEVVIAHDGLIHGSFSIFDWALKPSSKYLLNMVKTVKSDPNKHSFVFSGLLSN